MKKLILILFFGGVLTISAYSQPVLQWQDVDNRAIGDEYYLDMQTDASGNIYTTGSYDSLNHHNNNIITTKYSPTGSKLWVKSFDLSGKEDIGNKIFVDNSGYAYVVGTAVTSTDKKKIIVLKYKLTGELVWANTYIVPGYTGDLSSTFFGGAVYSGGTIYVASSIRENSSSNYDISLFKISSDGTFLSTATGSPSISERSNDITLDASGNIYIIGIQGAPLPDHTINGYLLRYTNSLGLLGAIKISDTVRNMTEFKKIAVNSIGNIIISGKASSTYSSTVPANFIVASFTASTGVMNWYRRYAPAGSTNVYLQDMVIDKSNTIIFAGSFSVPGTSFRSVICVYKHTGSLIRTNQIDSMSFPYSIAVDSVSNVYVSGYGIQTDHSVCKFDNSGIKKWHTGISTHTSFYKIILVKPGIFYVCGGGYSPDDLSFAKFSLPPGSSKPVGEITETEPNSFRLEENYPNPFNPITTIKFALPVGGLTTLKVYDIAGREVASLINENRDAGEYEVNFDATSLASGVYFYKLTSGSFTDVKKMTLVK